MESIDAREFGSPSTDVVALPGAIADKTAASDDAGFRVGFGEDLA
jgi:hypothetical protein